MENTNVDLGRRPEVTTGIKSKERNKGMGLL
jgi:hypothetical protein